MNAANAAQQQVVPQLPLPAPEPPLGREQLLLAATRAASDFAAGIAASEQQKDLAGKKFEFRIRFGCGGPDGKETAAPFGWTFDKSNGALKVRAVPNLKAKDAPVKAIAGEAFETVEGFWLQRPWLLDAVCPRTDTATEAQPEKPGEVAKPPAPETAAQPLKTVGIAQFFTATGPRTMRRSGRPYEATKKLDEGQEPKGEFDLILSGRIAPLPDGRVIACTRSSVSERPVCIVSVEFGKVWIERADTHEQIAQWGAG